jgi:hypothetical protein
MKKSCLGTEAWSSRIDTYGLVHEAKRNLVVALVLGGNLRPDASELGIGRSALANDGAVPAAVVVQVDDTESSAGVQAALDLLVEDSPVRRAEGAANSVADEILPADGDTEGVEAVVLDEVVHLVETGLAWVGVAAAAATIGSAAEVEASDLCDTSVLHSTGPDSRRQRTLTPAYCTPPEAALTAVVAAGLTAAWVEEAALVAEAALVEAGLEAALVDEAALVAAALVKVVAAAEPGVHWE